MDIWEAEDTGLFTEARPMLVQSLLRHAMAEAISEGFMNSLVVTSVADANNQLNRIHECLFARECFIMLLTIARFVALYVRQKEDRNDAQKMEGELLELPGMMHEGGPLATGRRWRHFGSCSDPFSSPPAPWTCILTPHSIIYQNAECL